jgi:pimeloyl-ACP methyl ester carboxylesterase
MARIVLVHGAFAGAWCWEPVVPGLLAAGHDVEAFDLPGSGADRTRHAEVTLDSYADRTCEILAGGRPAVLVGHSMGGVVVTQAAARRPELVTSLVYVAAFIPADGESLLDLTHYPEAAGDQVQANLVLAGDPPVATLPREAARGALLGSCDDQQAAWALDHLGPQPGVPFGDPFRLDSGSAEAFLALPRAYLTCLRDRAIPPALQRLMYGRAGCDPVVELDTDHSAWISATAAVVAALNRLAVHGQATAVTRPGPS